MDLHLFLNLLKGISTVMKNGSLSLGDLGVFLYIYKEKKQEVPYGQDFSWEAVTSETGDLSKGAIRVLVCTCAGNYAFVSQVC